MVFSSSIFLFLFLPGFFTAYYLTPLKYRSYVILAGSYAFYAWWRVDFLFLFMGVTAWNYCCSKWMLSQTDFDLRKKILFTGIAGNLVTLGYFKYANFGVDSLNTVLTHFGLNPFIIGNVILPIGISFYIFQAISYLVDVHRGDAPVSERFIDFAAFIALFPQLIAGPVLRYKDLADQFTNRQHSRRKFAQGASRFMQGFVKKVFIADMVAPIADTVFNNPAPSMADAWLGGVAYSIQLYFDFSGYSDMAIGLGLMMGFTFMENFNLPYISTSITEFWRRWHISLSSWLRDYLYIPLGGSRNGNFKTYRNLFLTMLLGGLWHGANWTFVLWGAWHGLWLALERLTGRRFAVRLPLFNWIACTLIVLFGWIVFRAETVGQAFTMYRAMLGLGGVPLALSPDFPLNITSLEITVLIVSIIIMVLEATRSSVFQLGRASAFRYWATSVTLVQVPLFLLSVSKLIASSYSPFLYFQF